MGNIDEALERFELFAQNIRSYLNDHYSEADTRVKFIDPVLTHVLGWDEHTHIRREENHTEDSKKRCIDYVISLTEPILVVEAKRLLAIFEIPTATNQIRYKLDGVIKKSWPNAWQAILQAQQYCGLPHVGARYAMVTNGQQFILFKALAERRWVDSYALCFASPQQVIAHFTDFYESISRDTVAADRLAIRVAKTPEPVTRRKPKASVGPIHQGYRNDMHDVCYRAFAEVLLDVPHPSEDFIRECYCTSPDVQKYKAQMDSCLTDPLPIFRGPVRAVRPGHRADPFSKTFANGQGGAGAKPLFILMGGPGAGKTMFLKWYFTQQMPRKGKENSVIVHVDFREVECEPEQVHELTLKLAINQLTSKASDYVTNFDQLREIFGEAIQRALAGPLKPFAEEPLERDRRISQIIMDHQDNSRDHLAALVAYLSRKCSKQVIIILDNMDQKSYDLQDKLIQ